MSEHFLKLSAILVLFSSTVFAQFEVPGDIVVTEFMADPAYVTDAAGEWFEIFNHSLATIDINGWHLKDNGTNDHTITNGGPLEILPGQIFLLSNNGNVSTNGGIIPGYVYYGFNLGNISDEIIITNASGVVIDSVAYSAPYPGKSWCLDNDHWNATDNDSFGFWCFSTSIYGMGDAGTPGGANDTCQINGVSPLTRNNNLIVNANDHKLKVLFPAGNQEYNWEIADVTGKIILSGSSFQKESFISLDEFNQGIYFFRLSKFGLAKRFILN